MRETSRIDRTIHSSSFPIEAIATYPLPGTVVPGSIAWSPDDSRITYLLSPDASLTRQLYAFDPATGAQELLVSPPGGGTTDANVSIDEALRRERQRQREFGVTSYTWAKTRNRVLVPLQGAIYVQDGAGAALRKLVAGGSPMLDPQISPDGSMVAYVQDGEIYVVDADGGAPRQLTTGAREHGKTNGLAEFVAQEEMDRPHGFWWSRDSRRIAFAEVDETHIPVYRIMHQGKDAVGAGAEEDHRYPFAGAENAKVRLAVVDAAGGEPRWLDIQLGDGYLARVDWLPDGGLAVQTTNRAQTELDLVRFDAETGARTPLLREQSAIWINLNKLFKPLERGGFIWGSERSGFRHLYLYAADGTLVRQLTDGAWVVDAVAAVDEERELVYFTANRDDPREAQLYAVGFAGGEPRRITQEAGTHAVVVDHARRRFVDTYQAVDAPPTVTLRSLEDGSLIRPIADQPDPRVAELGLTPPELVTLNNRVGTQLYGAVYRPAPEHGPGPWPAIVYVYGGPHVQLVANAWALTTNMRAQYLRSLGFVVFVLDNRGSNRRGLEFEGTVKHHMGVHELEDQVDGVRWLVEQGLADPERVGIYGWSGGGYMSAYALARAPKTFKVAVAGAPVTHHDGYDTHYTERYMGTPQENAEGYRDSSVLAHVDGMSGKLLLVHGLIDENVHFRHTARLINALIKARKPYDLLLFPDERHMPRGLADRIYMEEQIRDYFLRNL